MVQPKSSDQPVITFVTADGEEIPVPDGLEFHKYSQQTVHYLRSYGHISEKEPQVLLHSCKMPLPKDSNVSAESLKIIFGLLEQAIKHKAIVVDADEAAESPDGKETDKKTKDDPEVPLWVQFYFQLYEKDAILFALNSANYLDCRIFMEFAMNFIIKHMENFTIEQMCEYLNENLAETIEKDEGIISMKKFQEDFQREVGVAKKRDMEAEKVKKAREEAEDAETCGREESDEEEDECGNGYYVD